MQSVSFTLAAAQKWEQVTVMAAMSNESDTEKSDIRFDTYNSENSRNGGSREDIYREVLKDNFNKRKY